MNDYMQVRFDVEPCSEMATDVLAAVLAEIGYESFVPDERGVTAFVALLSEPEDNSYFLQIHTQDISP